MCERDGAITNTGGDSERLSKARTTVPVCKAESGDKDDEEGRPTVLRR